MYLFKYVELSKCISLQNYQADAKEKLEAAFIIASAVQGDYDGRRQPTASPMLTAIMSGGVEISGRELYKYR